MCWWHGSDPDPTGELTTLLRPPAGFEGRGRKVKGREGKGGRGKGRGSHALQFCQVESSVLA